MAAESEIHHRPRFGAAERFAPLGEWALVMLIFFVVGGAPPPDVNETHYLAKSRHYWDQSYCPGDAFFDSADAHVLFCWTFGRLAAWLPLDVSAWICRLAAWALLAAGWTALIRRTAPWLGAVPLSAALLAWLVDQANFAGEWVIGGAEGKPFAYAFAWLALAAVVRGRWTTAWILLGAASAWHVLVGGWATLAVAFVWATDATAQRPPLRSMAWGLAIGGSLALVGLAPALALERGSSDVERAAAAQIYVFERLPHHLAPLTLPTAELLKKSLRFAALTLAWAAVWRLATRERTSLPLEDYRPISQLMRFAAASLLMFATGLAIETALSSRPDLAALGLRYYWFRLADVAVPMAASGGLAFLVGRWLKDVRYAAGVGLAAVMIVLGGRHLFITSAQRLQRPWPPADRRVSDLGAWKAACFWIRDHAAADALCFIPRNHQSFKWYAERGDVGNWKDVPQNARSVTQWFARCRDLYRPPADWSDVDIAMVNWPSQLPVARVRELAQQYGFQFVVTRSGDDVTLPCVYCNDYYSVYWTPPPPASPRPRSPQP
ncbi:MAG: hypothetical protein KDA61_00010 [Planctomycetales bacterium]|nr:hypothetical protein [Planctomycetales bacterium]